MHCFRFLLSVLYFLNVFQFSVCPTSQSCTEPNSSSMNCSFKYKKFNLLCHVGSRCACQTLFSVHILTLITHSTASAAVIISTQWTGILFRLTIFHFNLCGGVGAKGIVAQLLCAQLLLSGNCNKLFYFTYTWVLHCSA